MIKFNKTTSVPIVDSEDGVYFVNSQTLSENGIYIVSDGVVVPLITANGVVGPAGQDGTDGSLSNTFYYKDIELGSNDQPLQYGTIDLKYNDSILIK